MSTTGETKRKSDRKPHSCNAGYVTERKSKHPKLPGYFVVYDRNNGFEIDADYRWVVMHEPSSHHISVSSRPFAQSIMVDMANGGDVADFGQHEQR